ncbi:MAG: TolC family protein [Bryobacterales bacterium]|nr:TolC family protein [Bryobacteraceae bacterium]MDW8354889.1 TolC family protein [Bryobacterales bacterium]
MRLLLVAAVVVPAWSQARLSLEEAVRLALEKHPSVEAAAAAQRAAAARLEQARSGYLPKLNYIESWQRSNNPVFVFGSLLTQHRFTEQNFAIGFLNRPDFLNNFQSQLAADQLLWDGGLTRAATRAAELGRTVTAEERRRTEMQLIAQVVRAYFGVAVSQEALGVAQEAVRAAEADLKRAEALRAAGMATDADVLAIRVHLAAMREQEIRRSYELDVARAALNEALGLPLDTAHELSTPLRPVTLSEAPLAEHEARATENRPELRQTRLAAQLAATQIEQARAALRPQVSFRLAFEADRQRFVTRGGANWFAGAFLRWNVFNGFADQARIREASEGLARARAQERQTEAAVRLEVRKAYTDLKAAQERLEVAAASVAMAEENLRIIRNRYEAGLTTVTELLRSQTALLEARLRRLAAIHDQRIAAAALELAAGRLAPGSEILR